MADWFDWDVALPRQNEADFIKIAQKLRLKGLIFLYEKVPAKAPEFSFPVQTAKLISKKELPHAAQLGRKGALLFGRGDRPLFENRHIRFLFSMENVPYPDHTHFRNSGMDQIYAKIARDKHKTVCLDLSQVLDSKQPEHIIGRMLQNRMLCDKYHVDAVVWSFATDPLRLRGADERKAFWRSLK